MATPEERLAQNITILLSELEQTAAEEVESEKELLLTDVWVGVVLSLMVLSCVCCVCSCFIYHKFQQWKHAGNHGNWMDRIKARYDRLNLRHEDRYLQATRPLAELLRVYQLQYNLQMINSRTMAHDLESGLAGCAPEAPLPSYTLVSGLPTYEQALEQLQQMRALRRTSSVNNALEAAAAAAAAAGNKAAVAKLTIHRLSVGELFGLRKNSTTHQQPPVIPATDKS